MQPLTDADEVALFLLWSRPGSTGHGADLDTISSDREFWRKMVERGLVTTPAASQLERPEELPFSVTLSEDGWKVVEARLRRLRVIGTW